MSANIHGRMVYSFEKPMWHNITEPSSVPMSAQSIMSERFGGGFEIFLRPVTVTLNDEAVETGDYAIVRGKSPYDESERVFGYCSDRFHPLQPIEIAKEFDEKVKQPAETMAFLGHGEDMFISWKMPSFDVRVGDEVESYGIVRSGFDTLNGTRLFQSIYRPVCANTITLAESWAKSNTDGNGKGNIWKGKGVNKNLLRDLGYWMAYVQESAMQNALLLQNLFGRMANLEIKTEEEAKNILYTAYPDAEDVSDYYPKELRASKQETTLQFNEKQERMRNGIFGLFDGEGTAISPDYWGMLCATSEYFCHVLPSKRPIAESVMFGSRQKYTTRMTNVLAELAK